MAVSKHLIKINLEKEALITEFGLAKLKDGYFAPGEDKAQQVFQRVAAALGDDVEHAQRLYDYMSDNWFMPATPILSNSGTSSGLGISCFLQDVDDSVEGIGNHIQESLVLSTMGGGLGANWSKVRSRGENTSKGAQTTGTMAWMTLLDKLPVAACQGTTRRGAYASYMNISHPEIEQFLETRNPTGGDQNLKCLNIHIGVNVTDAFMDCLRDDGVWHLTDPNSGKVHKEIKARDLWSKILTTRMKTGEPYLHFIDSANRALPQSLKDRGLMINGSNLCCEIELPTRPDRTAVCCLSSVNLEKYDEWKDNVNFIEDIVRLLDNNLQHFIDKAPLSLWRAVNSARSERSIGLGAFGFSGLLMKKHIPFESAMAKSLNLEVFKHIKERAVEASKKLAVERGEAPDMVGTGLRFAHLMALAPNASNATICGEATPSIEPLSANVFKQQTKAGTFIVINKYLYELLSDKYGKHGKELDQILLDIAMNEGSVQHLDWLDNNDKDVYKTAIELDQMWLIEHAADRAPYICQGQSLNLFFEPDVSFVTLSKVHGAAWRKGVKGLYYVRSKALNRVTKVTNTITTTQNPDDGSECIGCSG